MTVGVEAAVAPGRGTGNAGSLFALYRLLLRTQGALPRLLGVAGLGAVTAVVSVFARWEDDPLEAVGDAAANLGLGVVVPLSALWLGTAAIGDLIDDRLLVYLWLKPVPRWQLPAAAVLSTATIVVPLTAVPLAVGGLAAGAGEAALLSLLSGGLAAIAYAGLFVAAGLWFRRAAWWGLALVLLWENGAVHVSDGTARFTVTSWARSILSAAEGVDVEFDGRPVLGAVVLLPLLAVAGWLLATAGYRRTDVD